ncbi:MAG: hypothetical protein GY863_00285 [bacterium]|nr:hypothetical protein [bacterium]
MIYKNSNKIVKNKICSAFIPILLIIIIPAAAWSFQNGSEKKLSSGYKMTDLNVRVLDVFDSTETFYKYRISRLINLLNIKTTKNLIEKELLFASDSTVTESRIMESENNLRSLGIFQWVEINEDDEKKNGRNIDVIVKDNLTIESTLAVSRQGNRNRYSIGMADKNLFGRGFTLDLYKSNMQNRNFTRMFFKNPRSFGSRFESSFDYLNYNTAELYAAGVNKYFFSKETKWDMGLNFLKFRGKQNFYFSRDNYTEIDNQIRAFMFKYGRYFGDRTRYRLGIDINYKNEFWINDFKGNMREEWNSRSLIINFGGIKRELGTGMFIDYSDVEEDIHTGFLYNIGMGIDLDPVEAAKKRNILTLRTIYSKSFSSAENLFFEISHQRIIQGRKDFLNIFNSRFAAFTTRFPHHTIGMRVEYNQVTSPRPYSQVYLGENSGLRGYSLLQFLGNRSLLINLEDRFFSDLKVFFLRVGATAFFDAGKVWEGGGSFDKADWHSSAGFGLRLGIPKMSRGIIRIDFAYNMDENRFTTVSFSNGSYFSLLYPMDIGIPNFFRSIVN